jgi:hypothetical protein
MKIEAKARLIATKKKRHWFDALDYDQRARYLKTYPKSKLGRHHPLIERSK